MGLDRVILDRFDQRVQLRDHRAFRLVARAFDAFEHREVEHRIVKLLHRHGDFFTRFAFYLNLSPPLRVTETRIGHVDQGKDLSRWAINLDLSLKLNGTFDQASILVETEHGARSSSVTSQAEAYAEET